MKSLGRKVAAVSGCDEKPTESVELDGAGIETESPKTRIKCPAGAKSKLERRGELYDTCRKALIGCQRELRQEKKQKLRQTTQ